jgi:tetratricopeptide (TPR) repeat protein/DNA-binding CsgD family transcriptional regulator
LKHFLFVIATILLLLQVSCNTTELPQVDDIDQESSKAFGPNWFQAELNANLHVSAPAYCFQQIKKTMPAKAWRYSVENLYYNIPVTLGADFMEKWMNSADSILQDENVHAFLLMIRGQNALEKGAYDEAIQHLQESYALDVKYSQRFRATDAKRYLARCYLLKGEYPTALDLLNNVHDFLTEHIGAANQVRMFETMVDISRIGLVSNDPDKALKWALKAYDYCRKEDNTYGQMVLSSEFVARAYLKLNRPDSSLILLQSAQKIRDAYQVTYDSSNAHLLMGKTLCMLGKYPAALQHLQVAESSNANSNNLFRISEIWAAKGDYYFDIGSTENALSYYDKAISTSPDTAFVGTLHYKMSDIFKREGKFSQALIHFEKGFLFTNAFFSAQKDRTIGKLELSFALLSEEARVKLLTEKQKNHRIQLGLFILIFILTVGIAMLQLNRMRRRAILLEKEKELSDALQVIHEQELVITTKKLNQKESELEESNRLLKLKNILIDNLEQKISTSNSKGSTEKQLRLLTDEDWVAFKTVFEKQFPGYVSRLLDRFPGITNAEIRQFIFIKIRLESSEISDICGISINTVNQTRTRLRAKLRLKNNENLKLFVHNF